MKGSLDQSINDQKRAFDNKINNGGYLHRFFSPGNRLMVKRR